MPLPSDLSGVLIEHHSLIGTCARVAYPFKFKRCVWFIAETADVFSSYRLLVIHLRMYYENSSTGKGRYILGDILF
jgi:hypothetical protein